MMYYRGLAAIAFLSIFPSVLFGEDIRFAEHPSILLNASELADLRAQIDSGGWKAKVYNGQRTIATMHTARGIRTNAQMWLGRSIEIPGRGGHYHHFFCDDGDRLEYPADQRFAPGPYRCPVCKREYSGEKYEAAVRRLIHFHLAQAALDLSLVAALEELDEYAAKSAEILLGYAEAYPGPHTSSTKGGIIYQSLDESMWIIPLAQAYDLIHPRLRGEQRERIEAFLRTVACGIQACGTRGNWGSWHLSAVGVVGFAIQDAKMAGWAIAEFERQIRDELGDDGLWPESVHTYHYFPLWAFLSLAEAARHTGIDLYRRQAKPGKTLLNMFTAPLDYAYPDLRLPAINDGWFDAFVPADLYELAYARAKRPEFGWVIANGYRHGTPTGTAGEPNANQRIGMQAFLFGQDVPEQVEPPARRSINFPVMGICVLRSAGGAMMTFDYGPFLGHGQFDKMGATLFANDRLWMADYGTPGYGSPILPWYRSTWSHNTVVVDGKNQAGTKENTVQLWLGDAEFEAARSTTMQAYPGVTHTRTVIRTLDYFVVLDDLEAEDKHTYDLRWHGEGDLTLDEPLTIQSGSTGAPADLPTQITDLSVGSSRDKLQGRWQDTDAGVTFHVSADAPFVSMTAQCPAETGSRRIPMVICRREGTTASFTTVLLPFRGQAGPLNVQRKGAKLVITGATFTDSITLPADEQEPAFSRQPAASRESDQAGERPPGAVLGYINHIPPESADARRIRHREVARRRAGMPILVHRGASTVAPENTLEAYAAAMDLGADGCEIDIRRSKDGVLYLYHDDDLGRTLEGSGRIRDLAYHQILQQPMKRYGTADAQTRVPTLAAFLTLARERAMLIHLDVKEPGLQKEIAGLLDEEDMWDHIVEVNAGNAEQLRASPKVKLMGYKGWWPEGRHSEDSDAIRDFMKKPGLMIFAKDPRPAVKALKRKPPKPEPLPSHLRAMWEKP